MQIMGAVGEVHTHDAEGFLFLNVLFVEEPDMNDDLRRIGARSALEANTKPAVSLVFARKTLGRDGIGEDEKPRLFTTLRIEALEEQAKLVVQHGGDALLADIAVAGT